MVITCDIIKRITQFGRLNSLKMNNDMTEFHKNTYCVASDLKYRVQLFHCMWYLLLLSSSQPGDNVPFGNLVSSPNYEFIFVSFQADLDAGLCMFYDMVVDFICNAYKIPRMQRKLRCICHKLYKGAFRVCFVLYELNLFTRLCLYFSYSSYKQSLSLKET